MKKSLKILTACAGVFVLGLIMTVAGYATGGVDGFQKVAEDHDWISVGPVDVAVSEQECEFNAIESTGCVDLVIAGKEYYSDILKKYEITENAAKAGKVIVLSDKSREAPSVTLKGDKLVINGGNNENVPISIDTSSNVNLPVVIVLCGDEELENIKISSGASDVELSGIAFKKADIGVNAGDVEATNIKSKGIKIVNDAGDVELSGELKGNTVVTVEAGDIEIDVPDGLAAYGMDLHADAGDIEVGKIEIGGVNYTQKGGKDFLKLTTKAGSIEIGSQNR